jgi:hypothetical protein
MLLPDDEAWLDAHGYTHTATDEADGTHLILVGVELPAGLAPAAVDILVVLPTGFSDVGPDMFWCAPDVKRAGGEPIAGTDSRLQEGGRDWQRWSRHIGGDWRPGVDNLGTYIAYVLQALSRAAAQAA